MAQNKTTRTDASVTDFLEAVQPQQKREDSFKLLELCKAVTGFEPYMYGPTIVGFGNYHYKYATGQQGDAPLAGFSPRKDALTLYIASEFPERETLLAALGKHKNSKACVYFKKLADLDLAVLEHLITASVQSTQKQYPES